MTTTTTTTTDGTGREVYANYPALWHLEAIGVLDAFRGGARKEAGKTPTRVAVIDTSVAVRHPCLKDAIDTSLAIDFFSNRLGAFPYYKDGESFAPNVPNLATDVADALPATRTLLNELVDRLSHTSEPHVNGVAPCVSQEFSNHGTAIAGLVGARPAIAEIPADYIGAGASEAKMPLPYTGVDPFCRMVPISTNFDTDPEALILAFLYAEMIDAQVILLPRSIPDPFRTVPPIDHEEGVLEALMPAYPTTREQMLWGELAQLIVAISMKRPIVCAAGNFQESGGIYPANLACDHNGVIAVGAANAKGVVAGYSETVGATVMAPSNDVETYDRVSVRLDMQAADYHDRAAPQRNNNGNFSHFEVISTDVPGRHGYSYSPFESTEPEDGLREFGSYFCRFGGTSAASAITAGFVSLGYSLGEIQPGTDGLGAKNWLLSKTVMVETATGTFQCPAWAGQVSFPGLDV
ncbi:S8 family serine peptidase [Litorisediminicola beolgyonensis]|uniref:S8 family serine peptidase n=1 Tax=Litorisediminicola beolgyonensis TaxID=1173614 RepID=A0ABW3ZNL7_9RHOB